MTMKGFPGFDRDISRRHLLQLGAAGAAATLLPAIRPAFAQTGPDADLIAAAKAEGTLTYYHTTAIDITGTWTSAFTKKYGITTQNVAGRATRCSTAG